MLNSLRALFAPTIAQKLFLLATLPLLLAVGAIAILVAHQSSQMAQREIMELESQLLAAKQDELKNYVQLARASISAEYNPAGPSDTEAKLKVTQILSAMTFGREGYFFVYDYEGTNLVAPRETDLITHNWNDLTDSEGTPIVAPLIDLARNGGGYHTYMFPKPSSGEPARMMAYVIGLQDWQWAIGTGVFLDDVLVSVATARAKVEHRITRTFLYIGAVALAAVLLVFLSGLFITVRERRAANAKLKTLTQRIFDTQEEERTRVARELHDGISQILIGVRFALDLAWRRLNKDDPRAEESLQKGVNMLGSAIKEVRRISRDLRPGVLDDLGLGPALKSMTEEFEARTGITMSLETVVFRNRLNEEAKTALFRIAQEALTNIERHSGATSGHMSLRGHRQGATLIVRDNGIGIDVTSADGRGIGLRNMQERMDQLDGTLTISQIFPGTQIDATVPLKHILSPANPSPNRSGQTEPHSHSKPDAKESK